jgi:hypothetical protein
MGILLSVVVVAVVIQDTMESVVEVVVVVLGLIPLVEVQQTHKGLLVVAAKVPLAQGAVVVRVVRVETITPRQIYLLVELVLHVQFLV